VPSPELVVRDDRPRDFRHGDDVPDVDPVVGRVVPASAAEATDSMFKERIVVVTSLDDEAGAMLVSQLITLDRADPEKEISLFINSAGGSGRAALALYDAVQYVRCPVATVCVGQARAEAAMILASGAPGLRAALPSSRILIQQPRSSYSGTVSEAEQAAAEATTLHRSFVDIYVRHCGREVEEVERDMDRGLLLTARDAVGWGLIDAILERPHGPWSEILPGA
jgi:ATP-dependent Clp protease, protease subunit